jgi:CO/xanthine dehydrogenase FAD-binding subunit
VFDFLKKKLAGFFKDVKVTVLAPDEIVTAVSFRPHPDL